jgi:hypothetical protein
MIIVDERTIEKMKFCNLKRGDVFIDSDNDYCMRITGIDAEDGKTYNAVVLENGVLFSMPVTTLVTPVSAHLIVRN